MEIISHESITLLSIIIFSAFIHGVVGFGFPMIATPLIALSTDIQTAILATIIPTMMVNSISIIKGGNWSMSIKKYYPLIFYIIIGTVIGSYLLLVVSSEFLKILLAFTILIYLQNEKFKFIKFDFIHSMPEFAKAFFGLLSGIISGTTNVMIAVLIVYVSELSLGITASIQVMNMCFLSAKTTQLVFFSSSGIFGLDMILQNFIYGLSGLFAIFFGFKIRERFDDKFYKKLLSIFLYLMALLLFIK